MGALIDKTGQTFGRLIVTSRVKSSSGDRAFWLCDCECGEVVAVRSGDLQRGHTKSCGCLRAIHGCSGKNGRTSEYVAWVDMRIRCFNPNHRYYVRYGGRGISVCKQWDSSFESFLGDMGEKPSPKHSLDRIDNDGNYEPTNCRWATPLEQSNNRSSLVWITANGETHTQTQWSLKLGGVSTLVGSRLSTGWTKEQAVLTPVGERRVKGIAPDEH